MALFLMLFSQTNLSISLLLLICQEDKEQRMLLRLNNESCLENKFKMEFSVVKYAQGIKLSTRMSVAYESALFICK